MKNIKKQSTCASSDTKTSAMLLPARVADMEAMVAQIKRASAKTLSVADEEIRSGDRERIQEIRVALRLAVNVFLLRRHATPPRLRHALSAHMRALIARLRSAECAERRAVEESASTRHVVH